MSIVKRFKVGSVWLWRTFKLFSWTEVTWRDLVTWPCAIWVWNFHIMCWRDVWIQCAFAPLLYYFHRHLVFLSIYRSLVWLCAWSEMEWNGKWTGAKEKIAALCRAFFRYLQKATRDVQATSGQARVNEVFFCRKSCNGPDCSDDNNHSTVYNGV